MRPSLLALVLILILAGCARLQPAIQVGPFPPGEPAPAWLPAGWVRYEPRPPIAPERDLVQWFAPDGATAPLVLHCRYTAEEARRLSPVDLLGQLRQTFSTWPRQVVAQGVWSRLGARGGAWIDVAAVEPDDRAGVLHGRVAVAGTRSGALVVAGVLLPAGGDPALIERVLAAVPLD